MSVSSKLGFEAAPLLLGFVLGDSLESNFRRVLILGDGDWTAFVASPVADLLLLAALAMLAFMLVPGFRRSRASLVED